MLGSSRESLAAVEEFLRARAGAPGFESVGTELLAVAGVLGRESTLRATLSDSGTPLPVREGVVDELFGSRLGAVTVEVVKSVVGQRWSSGRDFVDALERLAAEAMFVVAEGADRIDTIEDELFRLGRAVSGSGELSFALTDPALPVERKTALVADLLTGRAQPETAALAAHVVASPRGRTVTDALEDLVRLAAVRRQHVSAEVTSAIALSDDQVARLAAALGRVYGRTVDVRTVVDPSVVGGISVQVGDEVIDGTTAYRLEQARRRLVG